MPPAPPDMRQVRRLLIVKLSSIGDVIHALPFGAALAEAHPGLEISWIVEEMSAPMVAGNPCLKEVIVLPQEWRVARFSAASLRRFLALARSLRERRFDVAVDLQGLSKSALVAWASGAPRRYGWDWLRELAPLLLTRVPRRPESVHIIDQFLDVARFLGAEPGPARFPIHIPDEDHAAAEALLRQVGIPAGAPFMVVNPSSGGGGNKGWGAQRFAALLDALAPEPGLPAVTIGSRADLAEDSALRAACSRPPASLVGRTSLKQLAALLQRAAVHVCGDTGSAHLAAALGTPVVSLFGRSNPARLAPYGWEEFALHHREQCAAACRRFHGSAPVNSRQKCLEPPPRCLAAIPVDEVAHAVRRALSRGRT